MKYFLVSDIHSFYDELRQGLKENGYDKNNPDHTLVILGDCFDRGYQTKQLLRFLRSIPRDRLILIKGNHEYLLLELLNKEIPERHDFSNGTVRTCCSVAGIPEDDVRYGRFSVDGEELIRTYPIDVWKEVVKKVKRSTLYNFVTKENWLHYYELKNYLLVHSFIPLIAEDGLPSWYINNRKFKYNPNWRTESTEFDFEEATWGCPWRLIQAGYFDEEHANGKTLICGHWRASDFYNAFGQVDLNNIEKNDTFISDKVIALDATTAISRQVNVFVIED